MMSSTKIFSVFSCILLINTNLLVIGNDIKYQITYRNKCLVSDLMVRYYLKISLKQCVWECAIRPVCWSINYRRQHLLCELYSVDDGTFKFNDAKSGPCVFVKKTSFEDGVSVPSTCTADPTTCNRIDCPKLTLDKGVILGNILSVGSTVKYVCKENYAEVNSNTYSTCGQTGEWSYTPRCIATACSATPVLEFSQNYTNIALNMPVNLSTTYVEHPGYLMVDGDHDSIDKKCAHTDPTDLIGSAMVDLGQSYTIHALYIINRSDYGPELLNNVSITIGDSMDSLQLYVYHIPSIGPYCTFVIPQPCRGRYVKIVNTVDEVLTICELEVYGE